MKKKTKVITLNDQRRAAADAAMPEVKRLVKKFGRTPITNCLNRLHEYEKSVQHLQTLKREVANLEKKLK